MGPGEVTWRGRGGGVLVIGDKRPCCCVTVCPSCEEGIGREEGGLR